MSTTETKTLEQLRADRARLSREIRAAERAAKKAEQQRLQDAQLGLGTWLAEQLDATTPEAVDALREVLDLDHARGQLAARAATESVAAEEADSDISDDDSALAEEPESLTFEEREEAEFSAGISATSHGYSGH